MDNGADTKVVMRALRMARVNVDEALSHADVIYDPKCAQEKNLELKAKIYSWSGDFRNASNCIVEAIAINSTDIDLLYTAGMIYFKFHKYNEAISVFDMALTNMCKEKLALYSETIYLHLGYCYIKIGDIERAVDFLRLCRLDSETWLHGLTTPRQLLESIEDNLP
jgi:tetratricopeptide (TPR) repeat protein